MTGVLSTSFSAIFINIAIPDIMADFAVPQSQSHWLITAFVTMGTLTMLLSGWGANRFGVRNLFIINLVVFLAASLLGGFGQHILTLVTARVFQGAAMG
ncbi:MAG: MFS transporter, partial [Porticoccaceae bacterium]|nr:MFS transporter [Porticoccaceae bacterium]